MRILTLTSPRTRWRRRMTLRPERSSSGFLLGAYASTSPPTQIHKGLLRLWGSLNCRTLLCTSNTYFGLQTG